MAHWKKMMDPKEMLAAFDLDGREVTLTIKEITGGELIGDQGRKSKKPIITFVEVDRKLALNVTNCKTIAQLYGSNETRDWHGKRITIFPTTTQYGGETKECIRIRPQIPAPATEQKRKGQADAA